MTKLFTSMQVKKLFVCLAILLLPILLCFCSGEEERITEIKSAAVKKSGDKVKIEVTLSDEDLKAHKGEKLFLVSLESNNSSDGVHIVGKTKAKGQKVFNLKISEMNDAFLSSALALASQSVNETTGEVSYTLITAPKYIENVSAVASTNLAPHSSNEIKGIAGSDAITANSVGATKTIIDVSITDLMLPAYVNEAVNYVFNGNSYYFDRAALDRLDKQIREANLLAQRVYLRTVISAGDEESIAKLIGFGGAPKSTTGLAPKSDSPEAMGYLRAFYSFIGERYSQSDMLVADYIIGSAVNKFEKNCYASSAEKFEDAYYAWLSVAGNVLHAKNPSITLYVSVDNKLRTEDTNALGAKVFLQKLSSRVNESGNIPFDIAISLGNGEDLGDILAGANKDIALVNANSFALLSELLASEEMLYNGEERGVIIDSLCLPTTLSEHNRGSYYAYTYYKAAEAGIDAFFLTTNEKGDLYNKDGERRDFFSVVFMCGTNYYSQIYNYLSKIKNSEFPKLSDYISSPVTLETEISCEISESAKKNVKTFNHSLSSMIPIGSSFDAMLSSKDDVTSLTVSSSIASGSGAVVITEISGKEILESGYIGINMYCDDICDVELSLFCEGEGGRTIYLGRARVGSVEKTYYFNITEFTEKIKSSDKITLALSSLDCADYSEDSITITDISLYGSSGNGASAAIVIVIVVAVALGLCGLLFVLTKNRSKKLKRNAAHS